MSLHGLKLQREFISFASRGGSILSLYNLTKSSKLDMTFIFFSFSIGNSYAYKMSVLWLLMTSIGLIAYALIQS